VRSGLRVAHFAEVEENVIFVRLQLREQTLLAQFGVVANVFQAGSVVAEDGEEFGVFTQAKTLSEYSLFDAAAALSSTPTEERTQPAASAYLLL
jgi:hypothetical protein